jgi:eukaryotic-like serine/threonine-protein kinase
MARCPTCGRRLGAGAACPVHPTEVAPVRRQPATPPPQWRDPVVGCLGEGGFATVWEARPAQRPAYALKVAKAATELATRRMVREAGALALIGAPWVPDLHDQGIDGDGHAWLAMELIRGECLGDLIATELAREEVKAILRNLLAAVARLHEARIIHRDLKPDNIIIGRDGKVTVLDLGMARRQQVDPDDPFAEAIAGSVEYMAPEQLDSGIVTERADVYAIGVIAFEMCALRPPFIGSSLEVQRGHRAMRPPRLFDAAPEVEALCTKALHKNPGERPSAASLLAELDSAQGPAPALLRRRPTAPALVRDRSQPVVVMWAELARIERTVLAMLETHKFRVVSQRGRRLLTVILANDHATPSGEALTVAEALVAWGAKVVVHMADCVVVGERITGPALTNPETWLPSGAWTGLRMTAVFAATIDRPVVSAADSPDGFKMLSKPQVEAVIGRAGFLDELERLIGPANRGPGLVLVTGEVGVGKSTVAEALRAKLVARGIRVFLASTTQPGRDRGPAACAQVFSPFLSDWRERAVMPDLADATRTLAKDSSLVLILDDIDLCEYELLDAIEYMTLGGGDRCMLWVVAFGSGQLLARRPDFGARAQFSHRRQLEGLDEAAAVELASKWLHPVDYVAVASLRPLLTVARGNPLHIVSLCRELHERGAVCPREDGGYFLDTTMLEQLPNLALAPWMATRQLSGLPEETLALARVCAILGEAFDLTEVADVVDLLDESTAVRIEIDAKIGLGELVAAGLLEEEHARYRFVNGLVSEGIYSMLDPAERKTMHELALTYWEQRWNAGTDDATAVPRIARHARAANHRVWAGRACMDLARAADLSHRFVEAEQQWSAALPFLDSDKEKAEALVGRARARYRQQRMADAIADAHGAALIARRIDDRERLVDALLEESTALDWAEDFATSAKRAREAQECGSSDPGRQVRIALATARATFRKQPAETAEEMQRVAERAAELGDHETTVIAAILAGHGYVLSGRVARATEMFVRGEAACDQSGDKFHFAALLVNRITLWSACGEIERGVADLREAIHLAREHGQAMIERSGAYNLAEVLLWRNQLDESFEMAQRSLSLQKRYGSRAAIPDLLLTLRIAAARNGVDDRERIEAGLAELPEALNAVDECFRAALTTWLVPTREAWSEVLARADKVLDVDQAIELSWLAMNAGVLEPKLVEEYLKVARRHPIWRMHSLPATGTAIDDISSD